MPVCLIRSLGFKSSRVDIFGKNRCYRYNCNTVKCYLLFVWELAVPDQAILISRAALAFTERTWDWNIVKAESFLGHLSESVMTERRFELSFDRAKM